MTPGVTLWLAALNSEPLRVVLRSELGQTLGRDRLFFNLQQAVEAYTTLRLNCTRCFFYPRQSLNAGGRRC